MTEPKQTGSDATEPFVAPTDGPPADGVDGTTLDAEVDIARAEAEAMAMAADELGEDEDLDEVATPVDDAGPTDETRAVVIDEVPAAAAAPVEPVEPEPVEVIADAPVPTDEELAAAEVADAADADDGDPEATAAVGGAAVAGGVVAGGAGRSLPGRRGARGAQAAAVPARAERPVLDPSVRVEDRASKWFVIGTFAVFGLLFLNAILLGTGGVFTPYVEPTPSPTPIPTAAPSVAPSASAGPSVVPSGSVAPAGSAAASGSIAPSAPTTSGSPGPS